MFLNQQVGAGAVQNVRLRIKTKKVVSSRLWSSLFSYGPLHLSPVGSDPLRAAPIGTGRARSTPILFGRLRSTPVDSDRLRSGFGRLRPALVGSDRFRSSRVISGQLQLAPAVSIALSIKYCYYRVWKSSEGAGSSHSLLWLWIYAWRLNWGKIYSEYLEKIGDRWSYQQ